jgi:hypothetical protein
MIVFFNEMICILLVLAITIIFIKTIYSHNRVNENFQDDTKPRYFGKFDTQNITDRLLRDPDIINQIKTLYKDDYNEKLKPEYGKSNKAVEDAKRIKEGIESVPDKYNEILQKYNDLNNNYKVKKQELEAMMIKDFNNTDNLNDFNHKNIVLRNKLRDFANTLKEAQEKHNSYQKGMILKNRATNNELTLVRNENSGSFQKYKLLNDINSHQGQHDIFYLALNGKCLQSNTRRDFVLEECMPKTMSQFFMAFEIKNNEAYNKYIKLSGNYGEEHLVNILDTSIEYPFFIISPFNIPGYAVTELNKQIFIHPVRNDPYQQFTQTQISSFCEITNN